jgi:hypothetical protein
MDFVPLIAVVVLFWLLIFFVIFRALGISGTDLIRGSLQPLPADLGQWREPVVEVEGEPLRQERWLLPPGQENPSYFLVQVRFLDPETAEIVRVVPERRVPRPRK